MTDKGAHRNAHKEAAFASIKTMSVSTFQFITTFLIISLSSCQPPTNAVASLKQPVSAQTFNDVREHRERIRSAYGAWYMIYVELTLM